MSHHFVSVKDLPAGGERFDISKVSKFLSPLLLVGGIGLIISAIIFLMPTEWAKGMRQSYAYSWLWAFQFFFTIASGGFFWLILHHAINAGWGVAVRRLWAHLANMMPWMFLLSLPLLLVPDVREALYEWMGAHKAAATAVEKGADHYGSLQDVLAHHPEHHDALLAKKFPYLHMGLFSSGIPGWSVRFVLYFAILCAGAYLLRRFSLNQEKDGDFKHTFAARRFACGWLPLFAIALTFSAIDWLKTLDYTWFSTMWGVYIFAGAAWASMALSIIFLTFLRSQGYLKKVTTMEHYHLMGKLLFAFTVFWAYIAFSQFFLIWYANITEETRFYLIRNTGGWNWFAILFLLIGHFGVPFVILLQAWLKKTPKLICGVCCWILFCHAVDIYWMIIPERGPSLTHGVDLTITGAWIGDILAFVTFTAILGYLFLRTLGQHSLYPWRDPRLQESINVHQ